MGCANGGYQCASGKSIPEAAYDRFLLTSDRKPPAPTCRSRKTPQGPLEVSHARPGMFSFVGSALGPVRAARRHADATRFCCSPLRQNLRENRLFLVFISLSLPSFSAPLPTVLGSAC